MVEIQLRGVISKKAVEKELPDGPKKRERVI